MLILYSLRKLKFFKFSFFKKKVLKYYENDCINSKTIIIDAYELIIQSSADKVYFCQYVSKKKKNPTKRSQSFPSAAVAHMYFNKGPLKAKTIQN